MAEIIPFRAIRYSGADDLSGLVCPPYDVINPAERQRLLSLPNNFVRIESPQQIGLSETKDIVAATASGRTYKKWLKSGVLAREKAGAFYYYSQEFELAGKKITRRGFFAALKLDEKQILIHERISRKPIQGRLELMKKTEANISPIFCLFPDAGGKAMRILKKLSKGQEYDEFTDNGGVRHKTSAITDPKTIYALSQCLRGAKVMIADGHHRYRTAIIFRDRHGGRKEYGGHFDYILAFLCPLEDPNVVIMATHRALRAYPDVVMRLEENFRLVPWSGRKAPGIIVYKDGSFFDIRLKSKLLEKRMAGYSRIPSMLLDKTVLGSVPVDNIFYTHDQADAISCAQSVQGYAFLLQPPSVKDVYRFAKSGVAMPPKTTFFYPKIPAGLVIYGF